MQGQEPAVSVLYFAALRELAGRHEELIRLEQARPTVSGLLSELELRHAALRGRLQSVRVAVNEEFVELATELSSGDVVALIPPVSGG